MMLRFSPVLLLIVTGCAADRGNTRYPSLLPRPIESRSDAEPVVTPVAVTPDPALDAKLAETTKTIAVNQAAFEVAAGRADRAAAAARGQAVGSDRWLDAQTALAELDTYRADASSMLTDLDQVAIERAADGQPPYPALDIAHDAAQAAFNAESAKIKALQALLPEA